MPPVEIKYLHIVWSNRETISKLDTSLVPLEVNHVSGNWHVETTTFPRIYTYIGFRIADEKPSHDPYFELNDGVHEHLMPVKAPGSDDVWWIQSGRWKKPSKRDQRPGRYENELFRTAGRVSLVIQHQKLIIENQTINFSVSELEYYLADFKDSLWMLILDNSSAAKANVVKEIPNVFTDQTVEIFQEFGESVGKILKAPGMILAETQGKEPRRSVRPVPRTFREYAIQPNARSLTSRVNYESYDTADNRYIHYCLKRVLYILKSLVRVAHSQVRTCANRLEEQRKRVDQLGQTDSKSIDHRVYDNEISKLKQNLVQLQENVQKMTSGKSMDGNYDPNHESGEYTVLLRGAYGHSERELFGDTLNGMDFRYEHGTYLVVRFPERSIDNEIAEVLQGAEVTIAGIYSKTRKENSKGNIYYQIEFHELYDVKLVNHPLEKELSRLTNRREELSANDWVAPMTRDELKERDRERKVVSRKMAESDTRKEALLSFSTSMSMLHGRLKKMEAFFKTHRIKTQSSCPNSMVFIQNPNYAATKNQFRKISNLNGLDESMLNSLMSVDEIGLVNVANLYEKWCLLQIIKVLTDVFNFELQSEWQKGLISAAIGNGYNIEIALNHPNRKQELTLTYEKELKSGKRPDFVIDISLGENQGGNIGYGFGAVEDKHRNRLVLDAKFKGLVSEKFLNDLVFELYEEKNYSEDKENPVFIIHPVPNVVADRTSPLDWGAACDYGQSHRTGHQYGSIFLSPSLKYPNTIDHLQRLLGMFLQGISQSTLIGNEEGTYRSDLCCISCGNSDENTFDLKFKPTQSGNDRWEIMCRSCDMFSLQTVCAECKHTLFKNGLKWTYHRTRAEQTSNAVCPKCETFL